MNPSTPAGLLEALAKDISYVVRACVATNPSTPVQALAVLGRDKRQEVRMRVTLGKSVDATWHARSVCEGRESLCSQQCWRESFYALEPARGAGEGHILWS